MSYVSSLFAKAAADKKRIVLSEGCDARVFQAAILAQRQALASVILVGDKAQMSALLEQHKAKDLGLELHDPQNSELSPALSAQYHDLRKHKGLSLEQAQQELKSSPYIFAALMVAKGYADGTVGGAIATTAQIVRTAIQIIGPKAEKSLISSFFLMLRDDQEPLVFADCGLVIDPNAQQLSAIALQSAASAHKLSGIQPRVAMLSFSSKGSAAHPHVDKVRSAMQLTQQAQPDLLIDGELQFDAAFVPEVAKSKAANSPVAGQANVFIFPDLNSGNIAYKIAQRMGGYQAIGPVLQGLAKPANDLSRGCNVDDVLIMIALTALMAQES